NRPHNPAPIATNAPTPSSHNRGGVTKNAACGLLAVITTDQMNEGTITNPIPTAITRRNRARARRRPHPPTRPHHQGTPMHQHPPTPPHPPQPSPSAPTHPPAHQHQHQRPPDVELLLPRQRPKMLNRRNPHPLSQIIHRPSRQHPIHHIQRRTHDVPTKSAP